MPAHGVMGNMHRVGAIIAGGEGRRFGADKALAGIAGAPMIAHVARALKVDALAVVGHAQAASMLSAAALSDPDIAVRGPLAGLLAALEWAAGLNAEWLVTAPCDVPLIPVGCSDALIDAAQRAGVDAAHAATDDGVHALCAVWRPSLAQKLRADLARGIHLPVRELVPGAVRVHFADVEAFSNVNTQDDLARLGARLAKRT
nr:MAG: molybdenum cofactor guanylyltransferase [Hyphomicrobiales bacterium]